MDLFILGLVFLLAIACIALIVAAPYLAIACAGAVAISELRKPLMIYFIIEGAVGLAQACGLAATIQLDRSERGEELLRELTQYPQSPFDSIEDIKGCLSRSPFQPVALQYRMALHPVITFLAAKESKTKKVNLIVKPQAKRSDSKQNCKVVNNPYYS